MAQYLDDIDYWTIIRLAACITGADTSRLGKHEGDVAGTIVTALDRSCLPAT